MSETKTEESVFRAAAVQARPVGRVRDPWIQDVAISDWPRPPQQACDFVNSNPAQGAGKAVFIQPSDYRIGAYSLI
ncbi:MAG: hypothetical protein AB7V40_05925 [Methyloceanibacter sp.]